MGVQVIYIAPLKALVKERMDDWQKSLVPVLGKKLVNLKPFFRSFFPLRAFILTFPFI